ncbi:histone-lysine N-methyltransferase ash1 [Anthonomus grandis grandis]|uniref:histone-lysine N-methyltransferase ash1 n=1 Tax=Anthonomus grandis grandis TaxID=2921223 RepID=UPI002166BE91|nr:histone-lysine N-methyltransferase ash1 [Anthonomus grandis grandis]
MAANDAGTSELFPGWSSVVHQPEDDPEESELPSTVDIGALIAEPPSTNLAHNEPDSEESEDSEADSSNSDASEASQESCTHSDSSDSDSSSSSQDSSSRSPSPEFSVTTSQTNGLRLTIATIRKTNSPINTVKKASTVKCPAKKVKGRKKSSTSSSSDSSSDSENSETDKCDLKTSPVKQSLQKKAPLTKLHCSKSAKEGEKAKVVSTKSRAKDVSSPVQKTRTSSNSSKESHATKTLSVSKDCNSLFASDQKEKEAVKSRLRSSDVNNIKEQGTPKSKSNPSGNVKETDVDAEKSKPANVSKASTKSRGSSSKQQEELKNKEPEVFDAKYSDATTSSTSSRTKERLKAEEANKVSDNDKNSRSSESKTSKKKQKTRKKLKKMSSLPQSRSSTYFTSDSESSDDLLSASCSLQEIRQEDLAAILPTQNECNDFSHFDEKNKDSPATGDISDSDMELPQQAINSLIQRTTESSSDGEGHQLPNPQTLFANRLLQQFVPTESLVNAADGETHEPLPTSVSESLNSPSNTSTVSMANSQNNSVASGSKTQTSEDIQGSSFDSGHVDVAVKRGRGRPKRGVTRGIKPKCEERSGEKSVPEFCGGPNVSPDSGIQNSPDHVSSPEPSISMRLKSAFRKDDSQKSSEAKMSSKTESSKRVYSSLRSVERFSKRIVAQEKQGDNVDNLEQKKTGGTTTRSQDSNTTKPLKKTSLNASENITKFKPSTNTDKYSTRRSSREKQQSDSSRTSSQEKIKEVPGKTVDRAKRECQKKLAEPEKSQQSIKKPKSDSSRNSSQEKVKQVLNKPPVTSNQFDRVLYANADRVLYPPRRKVGRPASVRKPGRPPRHKSENLDGKVQEKVPNCKGKSRGRILSTSGNSLSKSGLKSKGVSLKIPKILHSKHRHKHKKKKFKLLKPLVLSDPKINQEIEKLICDFVKFCVIASKQPKENVPEQIIKSIKKVTKKRRTTDHMEKKKKKQNVSTTVNKVPTCNDQRLPLKKRHYHLVSSSSENHKEKQEVEEEVEKVSEKVLDDGKSKAEKKEKVKEKDTKAPKPSPLTKDIINNNEYEFKSEKTEKSLVHVDEAIEACINKFADKNLKINEKSPENKVVPATTPKKRHRLENLNLEMEETTSDLKPTLEIKTEQVNASFEEIEKVKTSITVQSFINELKIKRNLMNQKSVEKEDTKADTKEADMKIKNEDVQAAKVQKSVLVSPESTKKKVRKRRAYNRTGFPTVKKKKKKLISATEEDEKQEIAEEANGNIEAAVCDRVPQEGEEVQTFVERSSRNNSMQDLTRIDRSAKFSRHFSEDISDCESLPLDERIDFDADGCSSRSESVVDKGEGDYETLSLLETSIERLKSRLDPKKRKRGTDKGLRQPDPPANTYPKRRRREVSPASSIEPSLDNRLRDSTSASGDELTKKNKKGPKWKKKYLLAGLFSDYYKQDETSRQETVKLSKNVVYNPEEHPYGLLPPPYHCGKYLRYRKVDFQLPYDIWWQHTHEQLSGKDIVPSWNYRKIRTNVYNVKNNGAACEPQNCNCKSTEECGDDCINRLVFAECPTSHRCKNQRIQKHDWAPGIEKFMTSDKGWGVRTREPIKQGEFILEYVGEVVSDHEFKERMNSIYINDTHHYCLHLDSGLVIDGHRMGGDGRFVNHSCQPNCEMQKWSVNGQSRMALFALRDIRPDEELTYDYNFSLFNPDEGQPCKCGSAQCRGVIGGKTQRVRQLPTKPTKNPPNTKTPGRVGRPRKTEAKKKPNASKETSTVTNSAVQATSQIVPQIQVKPMSHQQKCFILEHHCFLLRNLTKVRKVRDRSQSLTSSSTSSRQQSAPPSNSSAFINQLNALQKPRNIKTRRIAQAEDDPELNKTVKLAAVLKSFLSEMATVKGDKSESLCSSLQQLPSKRKLPDFYQKVQDPIDLGTIEQNVATGIYKTHQAFENDMAKLFAGFLKYYARTSEVGIATAKLKKFFMDNKQRYLSKLVPAKEKTSSAVNNKKHEEEDIIRCICGIPRDEGLMIQCEKCMVWQHIECVKVEASVASYHCEVCVPRPIDYEISMDEFTEHGHRYYMTLMRGDLQLRQGDTVYVLRDINIKGTNKKHTYETIGKIDYSELDIFRIEALWKDKDTGKRFAYGHHYLRPHETFHEPTRKFFPNEVMRVPLYEAVPVELIMEHCWVMDINTFCKGRPIGAKEEHVYICELRVDRGAKMFSKVAKSKFPICTKSFAFERFEERLKISRTYCPHDVDSSLLKNAGVGRRKLEKEKPTSKDCGVSTETVAQAAVPAPVAKTPAQQKARLNKILLNLLSKLPSKQAIDVSYLLEGSRRRKKADTK